MGIPSIFFPGFNGGVQEAVLTAGELPGRPLLSGVFVLCEGGGSEVLQGPEQDLQGEGRDKGGKEARRDEWVESLRDGSKNGQINDWCLHERMNG